MLLLDPSGEQSQDILTYFVLPQKREGNSSEREGEGGGGVAGRPAQLPMEGLKRGRKGDVAGKNRMKSRATKGKADYKK